jgi:hypothetical protein
MVLGRKWSWAENGWTENGLGQACSFFEDALMADSENKSEEEKKVN